MSGRSRLGFVVLLTAAWLACDPPVGDDDSAFADDDDLDMVEIPSGAFHLGAVDHDPNALPEELPRHEVTLSAFWLDLREVTVADFGLAVEAGVVEEPSCRLEYEDQEQYCNWDKEGRGDHPVNGVDWFDAIPTAGTSAIVAISATNEAGLAPFTVSADHRVVNGVDWFDARAYCEWLGKRLPTEAEFEYVLRARRINAVYPWGDEPVPPDGYANIVGEETLDAGTGWDHIPGYRDDYVGSAPVGSFAADPFGLYDVSGNVWEWTEDWFDPAGYPEGQDVDPAGVPDGERKVLRGGGYHCIREELRCSERHNKQPDDRVIFTGFRCAASGL